MASKKLTKRDIREDEFRDLLSEFYFGTIANMERHWKVYAAALIAVLVVGLGAFALWSRHESRQAKASYLMARVMEAYSAPVEEKGKSAPAGQLSFTSEAQKLKAVEARLQALQNEVGFGATDGLAQYYKALAQADSGNLPEAIATVSPLTEGKLAPLALNLRARLYEASKQWDKAEQDWKKLATLNDPTWPKGEGYWELGQFYERRSEKAKAIEAYQMVQKVVTGDKAKDDPLVKRVGAKLQDLKAKA